MAQDRETPQTIDEAAAVWAARMDRGPLSEQDADTLEAWLAQDQRQLGALMRARALFSRTESAWSLEPVFNPRAFRSGLKSTTRRRFLGWGVGGAVAASVVSVVVGYALTASRSYATERGEVRQVPLTDGSNLVLNTLSQVRIGSGSGADGVGDDIRLVTGEVLLSLADGRTQACVLRVGDWRLRADEGAFFVSALPGLPAQVTVHRGRLDVAGPGQAAGLRLDEGRRLVLTEEGDLFRRIQTVPSDQLARELAWREGQLAFHDQNLRKAAQAFARYSRQPIIIRDPALANESVSGLFAANDPAGFARAIGVAFSVEVQVEADRILIG